MTATPPPAVAGPLIDRMGRTFEQVRALGKKILPVLNRKTRLFMPSGGRKPKAKLPPPAMETPNTSTATETPAPKPALESSTADNGVAGSPSPHFDDVRKALDTLPATETPPPKATPEGLAEELKNLGENPTAETIIGLLQTGLILIGQEEGQLHPLEKDLIRRPLVRVLAKYDVGKDVLPPEVDLALAVLGVIAVRLQKPKTAAFAAKVRHWFKEKFFGMKGRQLAAHLSAEVGPSVDRA